MAGAIRVDNTIRPRTTLTPQKSTPGGFRSLQSLRDRDWPCMPRSFPTLGLHLQRELRRRSHVPTSIVTPLLVMANDCAGKTACPG